jgi:dTDP-4-amino-4,6-dideoxygalactose transaminase
MTNARIPFGKPFLVGKELFYIAQAVMSGSISGDGEFTQKCQRWLEQHLKCHKALLTHSCTAALEMVAILTDIGAGDEVIMPSFTFVSTANAFVLRGGVPVFVDIRPDTLNIDETLVEAAITPRTKAIVAVHYAGRACAMQALQTIAKRHGLLLIEDAAQAILSSDNDRALGTIGDLGCLSFHETKNVICGEGGALLINNPELLARAEIIWQKGTNRKAFLRGQVDKYTWVDIGSSFLPNELSAAFLYAQLENAGKINAHRRTLYRAYTELLSPLAEQGYFTLPEFRDESSSNAHIFFILTRSENERNALIQYLDENGITAVFHYIPLHNSPAGMRLGRSSGKLPVTEDISARLLRLPLYSELNSAQIRHICHTISMFYTQAQPTRSDH